MKLTGIAIDGYCKLSNIRLMQISPAINLVYGEKGTGKTSVANFISDILFGQSTEVQNGTFRPALPSSEPIQGKLEVNNAYGQYALTRDPHSGNQLKVLPLPSAGSTMNAATDGQSLVIGSLDYELFNHFFNVSFDTRVSQHANPHDRSNGALAGALHRRLGVPVGPEHAGNSSVNQQQVQAANSLRSEIASVRQTIAALQHQAQQLESQISTSASSATVRAGQLDQQIADIERRIAALTANPNSHELTQITSEIEELNRQINLAQPTYITPAAPAVDNTAAVYEQLDEIDTQLNRWRSVQNDVQQQRVGLRDEMTQWNQMTLESAQHPYHNARKILQSLEKRVDNAQSQTVQWLDSHGPTDSYQAAGFVDDVCKGLREELYVLCDELGKQYKQIRHRSAAAELKRLRRCYEEITENVNRLIQRRTVVIEQIRLVDSAGAEAILHSDEKYCLCAANEGHLQARQRFLGAISLPAAAPQMMAPDLSQQRSRLLVLESRRADLQRHGSTNSLEMTQLRSQVMNLRNELASLTHSDDSQWKLELARVQNELQTAMTTLQSLNLRLDEAAKVSQVTPNALLIDASQILTQLSHGELSRVWLVSNGDRTDLQVQDRNQRVLHLSGLSATQRTQTELALILAANQMLLAQGVSAPLIIDELFEDFDSDRIDAALQALSEFSVRGHQVVMLTQHRFLIDRANNQATIQFFNLESKSGQETYSGNVRVVEAAELAHAPLPSNLPAVGPTYRSPISVANSIGNGGAQALPTPATIAFSTAKTASTHHTNHVAVSPLGPTGYAKPNTPTYTPPQPQSVSSIKANQIGDRLEYAVTFEDHSALAEIGVFDSLQLRTLNDGGILSIADLLNVDLDDLPRDWSEAGLTRGVIDNMQSEIWLLTCVPALRPYDAHILVACGICEPDQLETSAAQSLLERVQRYLNANEAEHEFDDSYRITLARIGDWHTGIQKTRNRWRNGRQGRSQRTTSRNFSKQRSDRDRDQDRMNSESQSRGPRLRRYQENGHSSSENNGSPARSQRSYEDRGRDRADSIIRADRSSARSRDTRSAQPTRTPRMVTPTPETFRRSVPAMAPESSRLGEPKQESKPAATRTTAQTTKSNLKFYLDLEDHIEAAPSIGPKTAERFEKIGVFTIADFLKQTAESMATKLNYKRMPEDVIRSWQHQARLVCRIPNLRGHDAQLLVACDLIEPEEIASMQPQSLFRVMGPFSETKAGLKIIRSGKKPDLAEITDWIAWAQHTRSLQAA